MVYQIQILNFDPGRINFLELILMSFLQESVLLSRNGFDAIYITHAFNTTKGAKISSLV